MDQDSLVYGKLYKDIMSGKYNFEKSQSLAPQGYKWISNTDSSDIHGLDWYISQGYAIVPEAYGMYGQKVENSVALYIKKKIK